MSNPKRWCCESAALNLPANIGKLSSGHRTGKGQFHSNPKERQCQRMFKVLYNCTHFTCQQNMFKILQARLRQYMNWELPDVQAGFRKSRGARDQIVNIHWIIEKAREFQKKKSSIPTSLTILKPLTVWITTNWGKFVKRWEYQTTLLASWETCMQDKKKELELDMEQQTGPNWERWTSRLYIVTFLF